MKLLEDEKIKMEEKASEQDRLIKLLENEKANVEEKCIVQEKSLNELLAEKTTIEEKNIELEKTQKQLIQEKTFLEDKNKELENRKPVDASLDIIKEKYNELILALSNSTQEPQTEADDMNKKYFEEITQRNIELEEITTEQKLQADTEERIVKQIEACLEQLNAHIGNPGIQLGDSSLSRWSNILLNLEAVEQYVKKIELDIEQQKAESNMAECEKLMLERSIKEIKAELESTKQVSLAKDNDLEYYKDLTKASTEQAQKQQNYIDELMKEKVDIQEKIERVEKDKEQALIDVENLKSENINKSKELEEKEELKNNLTAQIEEIKARCDRAIEEKEKVEQEKLGLENKNKDLLENEKKLQINLQTIKGDHQKALLDTKDKFDELNMKIQESQMEKAVLEGNFQKDLQVEKNKVKQLEGEISKLHNVLSQKEAEDSTEKQRISDEKKEQEKKIAELNIEIDNLKENLGSTSKLKVDLESEIEKYKQDKQDSDSKIEDLTAQIQKLLGNSEKQLADLQGEKNLLLQKIDDFEEQIKAQNEEQNLLKSKSTDLDTQLKKAISDKNDLLLTSQDKVDKLAEQLKQSQDNEKILLQELADNKKSHMDMLAVEKSKGKANANYDKELNSLRAELDSTRSENIKLLESHKMLEATNKKQEETIQKAVQFKLLDKSEKTNILQKLQNEGEEFKEFYCNFKDNPIKFPGYVIDKMSLTVKEQQQKIDELAMLLEQEVNTK